VGDGAAIALDGALHFALGVVGGAEPEVSLGEIFGLFEGFALRADGLVEHAFAEVGEPEVVVGFGELAVALVYGGAQSGDRAIEVARAVEGAAQVAIGAREDGLLAEGFAELRDGFLAASEVGERQAEVVMGAREVAAALTDGLAEGGLGILQLAALGIGQPEVVVGFGEMIVLRQRRLEGFDGGVVFLL